MLALVYFVQAIDGGPIKVGTTGDLVARLKWLRIDVGKELRVLAVIGGSFNIEKALHRKFSHLRVENEWFSPDEELLGFISETGQEWVGDDESSGRYPEPEIDDHNPKGRRYVVAKIDVEAVTLAKKVAALRGLTLADYLSEIVLPIAAKDLQVEANKISRKPKPPER